MNFLYLIIIKYRIVFIGIVYIVDIDICLLVENGFISIIKNFWLFSCNYLDCELVFGFWYRF